MSAGDEAGRFGKIGGRIASDENIARGRRQPKVPNETSSVAYSGVVGGCRICCAACFANGRSRPVKADCDIAGSRLKPWSGR